MVRRAPALTTSARSGSLSSVPAGLHARWAKSRTIVAVELSAELDAPASYDLVRSQASLRLGPLDPVMRIEGGCVWRATRTPAGPASYRLRRHGARVELHAWGEGAPWVLEHAAALTGLDDDPSAFETDHPVIRELERLHGVQHMPRTLQVFERLVPTVLQQLVTWREARRAYLGLVRKYGEDAPGPAGLRLLPAASTLRRLAPCDYVALGVLPRHATVLRQAALVATRLDALISLPSHDASRRMQSIRGIGPWTAGSLQSVVFGDPDAVLLGDFHLPREVSWALTRRRDGDDAQMLELLEPFRGHRWRAIQLIRAHDDSPPRRAPRRAMRPLLHR
jgi:3-methyladenine DNA glycosylase/8-oxoguanine DNA glycosylase